jgi:hypothetical protein
MHQSDVMHESTKQLFDEAAKVLNGAFDLLELHCARDPPPGSSRSNGNGNGGR